MLWVRERPRGIVWAGAGGDTDRDGARILGTRAVQAAGLNWWEVVGGEGDLLMRCGGAGAGCDGGGGTTRHGGTFQVSITACMGSGDILAMMLVFVYGINFY